MGYRKLSAAWCHTGTPDEAAVSKRPQAAPENRTPPLATLATTATFRPSEIADGGDIQLQVGKVSQLSQVPEPSISNPGSSDDHSRRDQDPRHRILTVLKSRCPDHVPVDRWQAAVEDGRAFLATWGEQAEALGWTARDLFGLHTPPEQPHPSYRRLSRYDATGLCWLLQGRPVVALTEATAAIENPTGAITIYRRHNKPALGPLGDSLDDFQ
jgi:hypothetical protein